MVRALIDRLFRVRRKPGEIYMSGPIRIKWRPDSAVFFFDWHAVQDRGDIFFQYYHIGPILIQVGRFTGHYNKRGEWRSIV